MAERKQITIDVSSLYHEDQTARLSKLDQYAAQAQEEAGQGNDVRLTGAGPIWLYLRIAHALHGKARKLIYDSPVSGPVTIFNHNPD